MDNTPAIPAALTADIRAFGAAVTAAAPLTAASKIVISALLCQGQRLLNDICAALSAAVDDLDAGDPVAFAGDLVFVLDELAPASLTQAALVEMRGYVGRAQFNLTQALAA